MYFLGALIKRLRELNDSGSKELPDGTLLLGKLPPRKDGSLSNAYLHEIYAGLNESQLERLNQVIRRELPEVLQTFYRNANGLSLFADSLSVNGLREDYSRGVDVRLPASLEYGNVIERPKEDRRQVRFGFFSYGDGAEVVLYDDILGKVFAVPRWEVGPVLYEWPSFDAFLTTEVDRMIMLYHKRQGKLDFLNPLPPPWIADS